LEKTLRYSGPDIENRAREILNLQDLARPSHALPVRVGHLWRAENFASFVPYTGSFLLPLGRTPDMEMLQQSIAAVTGRHEALRSRLAVKDGAAVMLPERREGEKLQRTEASRADIAAHRDSRPGSPLTEFFREPINLLEQTGFRCRAFRDEDGHVSLGVLIHHYFGDAWSSQIIRREFETVYAAHVRGAAADLPPVAQYSEYALFQRRGLEKHLSRTLAYWHAQLKEAPPSHPPFDQRGDRAFLGRAHFLIEDALMQRLAAAAKSQRLSLAILCYAGFQIALAKWCGTREIVSAVQLADRIRPQFQGTVGYLLTAIAIHSRLPGDMRLREFLAALARDVYDGIGHQDLAFELYDEIFAPPQPFCTPRFNFTPRQESFFLGDNEGATPVISGIQQASDIRKISAYRDLQFLIIEYPQGLVGRAVYNKDLSFDKIAVLIKLYQHVLDGIAADPDATLGRLL
jgi:Condensation domain